MRAPYRIGWNAKARRFLALNPFCVSCGAPATDADHVIPRIAGGHDGWDNLQPLCHRCHSRRTLAMHVRPLGRRRAPMVPRVSTVIGQW